MKKLLYTVLIFPLVLLSQNFNDVTEIRKGNTEIHSLQKGDVVVWEKPSAIDLTNLVAYYTMESNPNDVYGTYNGTATNGAYSTGKIGQGFEGDGNQDYIRITNDGTFSDGNGTTDNAFSYDGWFKFNDNNQQGWLIDKRNTGTSNQDFDFQFFEGVIAFTIFSGGTSATYIRRTHTWVPTTGIFYHLAATYDGSGTAAGINIYIDGVSVGTTESTGSYVAMGGNNTPITIGAFGLQLTSTTRAFDGVIDNVKYWKEVLTPEKIASIMAKENSGLLITQ